MARVFQRRECGRQGPKRRRVVRGRRVLVECLVWPVVVVLLAKSIEAPLLRRQVPTGRPRRLGFQRAVHALMPTVLLRRRGRDQLGQNPEADPPDRQGRESAHGRRRERDAVVGAHDPRQAILAKEAQEDRPRDLARRREDALAPQQVGAVAIDDCQRIAVDGVAARPELTICARWRLARTGPTSVGRDGRFHGGRRLMCLVNAR